MPQPKWYGKSLSALCMDSIIDNVDRWIASSRGSGHVSNQFHVLPSHCLWYMTESLRKENRVTEETLSLLVNLHLKILDLSRQKYTTVRSENDLEINSRLVRLASIRSLQIIALRLCSDRTMTAEVHFPAMLQRFEHLQLLHISNTNYGASCLPILGSTGKPQLRELKVKNCPGVTNTVIQDFCIGQRSLFKLSVRGTEVTHIGARFAIEHLPELEKFNYDMIDSDFFKIFDEIHGEARELKQYSLTKLYIPSCCPYKKGSISLIIFMCPSLVDISMYPVEGITDVELLGFRELKQINSLQIKDRKSPSFTFHGGILPILKVHGHTLETLMLPHISSGKIKLIIDYCPNIRSLYLTIDNNHHETTDLSVDSVHSSLYPPKGLGLQESVVPLQKLEDIYLESFYVNLPFALLPKIWLLLLSSPSLVDIHIVNCSTLTDQIIEKVCAGNSFENLTHLQLWDCPAVSQKGIDFFMNEKNPLEFICLRNCGYVDFEDLKNKAKKNHWDQLTITDSDSDCD